MRLQQSHQEAQRDRLDVHARNRTAILQFDALDISRGNRTHQSPDPASQIGVLSNEVRHRPGRRRGIQCISDGAPLDRIQQDFGRLDRHLHLGLFRAGPEVWRDHAIVQPRETDVLRGLRREHIQCRRGNAILRQGIIQSVLVNNAAAGTVHQANRRLHHRQLPRIDHVQRLLVARHVHADVIRFLEDALDIVGDLDALLGGIGRRRQGIVAQNLHIEATSHLHDRHADPPQADHA